jgi:Fe-S oxidoreductase
MDDRSLFRYAPDYKPRDVEPVLDWSDHNGFLGAVEMCNNNGACRKIAGGVMCPSYRVTNEEKHLTRGRANTLRLALTGQLGTEAFSSQEMAETMDLCVSCKGCRRECPTGVDMARMKIEVKNALVKKNGLSPRDRLVGLLPKYAEVASRFHFLSNLRDKIPFAPWVSEKIFGFSAKRALPVWNANPFRASEVSIEPKQKDVVLLADTFNTYFEPENLRAALRILEAGNYKVHVLDPENYNGNRLCCGRTYLSAGLVDEAKKTSAAMIAAYKPFVDKGMKIIGLEPSCLNTLKDEFLAMNPGSDAKSLADSALMLEEFLVQEHQNGTLEVNFSPIKRKALVHGHCHQKAFGAMGAVQSALNLIPDLEVELIDSSCCGMAGSFGYEADHYDISMAMAELDLLPAIRAADDQTLIVADGTSCRHQIKDGIGKRAEHVAIILERALG